MKLTANYFFRLIAIYSVLSNSVFAQGLPFESPESLGLSSERLDRIVNGSESFSSDYHYNSSRSYYSGGGGLASTTSDYYKFLQMLLNKGQLNGEQLLGKKTVELMTTAQADIDYYWGKGEGFGFGSQFHMGRDIPEILKAKELTAGRDTSAVSIVMGIQKHTIISLLTLRYMSLKAHS